MGTASKSANSASLKGRGGYRSRLTNFCVRLFKEKPLGAFGAVMCLIFLFTGVFADLIAPFGYNEMNPIDRLKPPSIDYLLGTDQIGRDVFSRIVHGARTSLIIGFSAAFFSIMISSIIGVTTGYFRGKFDFLVQRMVDAWMSFPDLVVVIVAVSVFGPGMWQVILVLSLLYGIAGSRIVRGAVLTVKENDYVHAAPRTIREPAIPYRRLSTKITCHMPGPKTDTATITTTKSGKLIQASTIRCTRKSNFPRKYPVVTPIIDEIIIEKNAAEKPIINDVRAP
jgi:ABC-type dipeptide/oligopeptide/nickel transport system permease subunit